MSTSIQYQRDKWSYILCPFLFSRVTSHQRGKVGAVGTLRFLGPNLFSAGKEQEVGPWGWPGSSLCFLFPWAGYIHSKDLGLTPALLVFSLPAGPTLPLHGNMDAFTYYLPPGQVGFLSLRTSHQHWTPLTPTPFLHPMSPAHLNGSFLSKALLGGGPVSSGAMGSQRGCPQVVF